jgi:hypothetical protein
VIILIIVVTAGGAAWVTETNVKLGLVIRAVEKLDESFQSLKDELSPMKYFLQEMDEVRAEDYRLQLQIDKINEHISGHAHPNNHRRE